VSLRRTGVLLTAVVAVVAGVGTYGVRAQDPENEIVRRAKTKVQPAYPELARKMNITGTVKVIVVVAPNGTLKNTRVLGGNPVLVNAAVDALKRWKFEPASQESTGTVEFKFQPQH